MIPLHDDNPTTIKPFLTIAFIVSCSVIFLWQLSLGTRGFEMAVYRLGVIPAALLGDKTLPPELAMVPPTLTVFTSMFMHGGWMHLIGNMLYLWIFGNNIEDAMGHVRFVVFYLLCGIAAVFAQALPNMESTIPMIGASGAISGVLGAYLLLFPRAHVLVLVPLGFFTRTMYLPAMVVLGFWFLLQLINSALADPGQGGVAFGAHIGGFIAGMVLLPLFKYRHVRLFTPPRH
ncbi:MAG: rhomboid family intramembrane serine protease [Gammaproteobacteria bacterium]|nr:rhomboid family intramembrane serine protease [Gammaproteobacteria bacterium]MDH3371538.1 rhomboid family intramembrane serine protease [Gammaproteobacteria bacterium]MDH3406679.1 rhomboid family intramembrane serine protease [Gammaproteobacteria bacterium]MDH3563253.1 rhomboid family intramembrane serine protease [Gammaproteobacteria bacterium]MDH5486015.1 rhomboid family intramembrane serine protease [Gammaproteobacteria bacterium]